MKTFRDSRGRTWTLDVTCDTIQAVKDATAANLLDLLDPHAALAREVAAFPPLAVKLLYAALAEEAAVRQIDEREFRRSFGGDCLEEAADCLLEELVNFCPKHRRSVTAAVLQKQRAVEEAAARLAMARLHDPTLETQLLQAMEANLRTEMERALGRLAPPSDSATASSTAAGGPPDCSAFPAPDRTPGEP